MSPIRIDFPRAGREADANIWQRYPADRAAWIWHPRRPHGTAFLRFTLDFSAEHHETVEFQVSADQRFQLSLDGEEFARGPDRSDLAHWSLHTYRATLPAGTHRFSALVWWLNSDADGEPPPPMAQCSFRGGFLFAGLGDFAARCDTGSAPWRVEDLTAAVALEPTRVPAYHDIGPSFNVSAALWNSPPPAETPVIVRAPIPGDGRYGVAQPGWRLEPTPLPEQLREYFSGGNIISVSGGGALADWQRLLAGNAPLTVPPRSSVSVLWDFGDYHCGFPVLQTRGGDGAEVTFEWAEALYPGDPRIDCPPKTHRDRVAGCNFLGFGERFRCGGEGSSRLPVFWWRSGRFVQICATTGAEPLTVERLGVQTTRYPLTVTSRFDCDDASLPRIASLAVNTMRQGMHEQFTDSPYYEQMAYVGDNVTESLVAYTLTRDARLPRRDIELFDWSRAVTGLVAERWPCRHYQGSATYAMLWPLMVKHHAWWRDEPEFTRERLRGVRHLIEELLVYHEPASGLLGKLPGWSFVDWVPEWECGYPPGHAAGDSAIIQMHWLLCLRAAAELEESFGEPEPLARWRRLFDSAAAAVRARYYDPEAGLFFDESGKHHLSEHAGIFAALLGLFPAGADSGWQERLAARQHAKCGVYFLYYLLEVCWQTRRADLFFDKLALWRGFLEQGLHTIPEHERANTRSDCHAWGAHPLWHFHASVAGIRPASPGFATVSVRPLPGALRRVEGRIPHPRGEIIYAYHRDDDGRAKARLTLPATVSGVLFAADGEYPLRGGENEIDCRL